MFIITYDFLDTKKLYHKDVVVRFESRDDAVAAWLELKKLEKEGSVYNIRPDVKKYNYVKVTFGEGRLYTYLTNSEVKVKSLVVVKTKSGYDVVTVMETGKKTRAELEKVLPWGKYKHIEGILVPA